MKILLFTIVLFAPIFAMGQNITASELITMPHHPLDNINKQLLNKGFQFYKKSEPNEYGYTSLIWGYFDKADYKDLSKSWYLIYNKDIDAYMFSYQFGSKKLFNELSIELNKPPYKRDNPILTDTSLTAVYLTKDEHFELITNSRSTTTSQFIFTIQLRPKAK